jgi:hypothetical protein
MLTGGIRNVAFMEECLETNQLDIIGIARPYAVDPNLTQKIFNKEIGSLKHLDSKFSGSLDLMVHEKYLKDLGVGKEPKILEGLAAKWFFLKNGIKMLKGGNK